MCHVPAPMHAHALETGARLTYTPVPINSFNNDVIGGKALKFVLIVLSEFSQIANIELRLHSAFP